MMTVVFSLLLTVGFVIPAVSGQSNWKWGQRTIFFVFFAFILVFTIALLASAPVGVAADQPDCNDPSVRTKFPILCGEQKSLSGGASTSFEEVNEKFGTGGRLTDLQKNEEWKKYQGQCVEWKGELTYVNEGFLGGISLGFKHVRTTLTYDVLVSAPRSVRDMALGMQKGAHYQYRATLKSYGGAFLPISADWGCR